MLFKTIEFLFVPSDFVITNTTGAGYHFIYFRKYPSLGVWVLYVIFFRNGTSYTLPEGSYFNPKQYILNTGNSNLCLYSASGGSFSDLEIVPIYVSFIESPSSVSDYDNFVIPGHFQFEFSN